MWICDFMGDWGLGIGDWAQSPKKIIRNLNLWKKKIKNNIFNSLLNNLEKIN